VSIDDNEHLANQYDIEAVPTLLLFRAGKLVKKMEGFEGKAKLRKWVG
jgi:thioredoxin-like negative regulator of GroEL